MTTSRRRLLAVTGATLALLITGTAIASAHPRDDRGHGRGGGRMGAQLEGGLMGPMHGLGRLGGGLGGLGLGGAWIDGFIRSETTVDMGEAGVVTHRRDHGTVSAASETELSYALATGEAATVTVGEDTQVWSVSQTTVDGLRPFRRPRLSATQITLTDVVAGSEVMVWATSQEDGSFLAQRIVVQPVTDEATDAAADTTGEATSNAPGDA